MPVFTQSVSLLLQDTHSWVPFDSEYSVIWDCAKLPSSGVCMRGHECSFSNAAVKMGQKHCLLWALLWHKRESPNLGSDWEGITEVVLAGGRGQELPKEKGKSIPSMLTVFSATPRYDLAQEFSMTYLKSNRMKAINAHTRYWDQCVCQLQELPSQLC